MNLAKSGTYKGPTDHGFQRPTFCHLFLHLPLVSYGGAVFKAHFHLALWPGVLDIVVSRSTYLLSLNTLVIAREQCRFLTLMCSGSRSNLRYVSHFQLCTSLISSRSTSICVLLKTRSSPPSSSSLVSPTAWHSSFTTL